MRDGVQAFGTRQELCESLRTPSIHTTALLIGIGQERALPASHVSSIPRIESMAFPDSANGIVGAFSVGRESFPIEFLVINVFAIGIAFDGLGKTWAVRRRTWSKPNLTGIANDNGSMEMPMVLLGCLGHGWCNRHRRRYGQCQK
jgi:hypothetical protein